MRVTCTLLDNPHLTELGILILVGVFVVFICKSFGVVFFPYLFYLKNIPKMFSKLKP